MSDSPPKVCRLTAAGRSAVAVVAARGADAGEIIARVFQPTGSRDVRRAKPGNVYFGHWRSTGEELVVCVTSQQWEVHCHGGIAAAPKVMEDLVTEGCHQVAPEDWVLAPGETPAINLAMRLLADAATPRVAGMLLDQARGAWSRAAEQLKLLLHEGQIDEALNLWKHWERIASCSTVFTRPWRVAIGGAPNAGKSTLLNALLGYERAVVWDQPGTTRDVVETLTVLDGWPILLWDTAGIRESEDLLEQEGARRAKRAVGQADVLLELVDLTDPRPMTWEVQQGAALQILRIGNKSDLLEASQRSALAQEHSLAMCMSANSAEDVAQLARQLVRQLAPYPPAPGDPLPVHPADREQLWEWRKQIADAS